MPRLHTCQRETRRSAATSAIVRTSLVTTVPPLLISDIDAPVLHKVLHNRGRDPPMLQLHISCKLACTSFPAASPLTAVPTSSAVGVIVRSNQGNVFSGRNRVRGA